MKRQKSTDASDTPALDISSLIDVCFLLLIYFLVATTLQKSENELRLRIPVETDVDPGMPDRDPLLIRIDAQGAIWVGSGTNAQVMDVASDSRQLPLLTTWLKTNAEISRAANKEPMVQIWADREAQQQRVIDVLNVLAGEKIQLAAFTDLLD
jgi:biopolymer transport protein ExbD